MVHLNLLASFCPSETTHGNLQETQEETSVIILAQI